MDILIDLFLVALFVALNGFFVAAEFAIVKVRSIQFEHLVQQNDKQAKLLKHVTDHLDEYLSATQVGITLASLALGWVGEPVTERLVAPVVAIFTENEAVLHSISIFIGFAIITVLHIVLGEMLPKSIAISYEKRVSLKIARPLHWFFLAFSPLIRLLNGAVVAILKMIGLPAIASEGAHTAEEIKSVLMESARKGIVTKGESELIESVFAFSDTTAENIMVHRSDVVGINLEAEPLEIFRVIEGEGFSRLPTYRGSMDEITGVLYVKSLLPHFSQLERLALPSMNSGDEFFKLLASGIKPPKFINEKQALSELLVEFQRSRTHMAIVVSEHGGVEGIVTLEDILEEIVGEIQDESDIPSDERNVIEVGDALYIDPSISVADFNEQYGERFPVIKESEEYQTMSGYVQMIAARIPSVGDVIDADGLRFTIKRKVRHRLEQIKVEKVAGPNTPDS